MARKSAPTRIWATVNGARSVFPNGVQYLIGGWEGAPREHGTEYIRADVVSDMLEALKEAAEAFKPYDRFKVDVDAMHKISAAIAKAEGRS